MTTAQPKAPTPDCMSQLAIDEWNAGDMRLDAHAAHAAHLERCEHCRRRVDAAARSAEAFLERFPDRSALAAHVVKTGSSQPGTSSARPQRRRWAVPAMAAALAAAAAALLIMNPSNSDFASRTKGAPRLGVYIEHGAHVRKGHDNDEVRPGDTLRFAYTAGRDGYLAIWGNDGEGLVLYHPEGGTRAAPAARGKDVALPFGLELDAKLGVEIFYGVFCSDPVATAGMRAGLAVEREPKPPAGCSLSVLRLRKRAAR